MFAESEQHMLRAQAIAPQPIDRALKQYSENYNRLVIDETVPRRLLWQKGYRMFCADGRAADDVWDLLFAGIPRRLAPFILICFGSGVLLAAWRDTRRIAAACPVCGKAFCHRCQKNIATETMCSQCLNFISKKDSIDFRLREGKMAGIRRHRTIDQALGAALSLCLSGAGHIWQARVVRGAIGLFLFFVLASKAVAVAALMSIVPLAQSAATLKLILLAVLLTVYWLVWAASFFRLQRRQRHDNLLVEATLSK